MRGEWKKKDNCWEILKVKVRYDNRVVGVSGGSGQSRAESEDNIS